MSKKEKGWQINSKSINSDELKNEIAKKRLLYPPQDPNQNELFYTEPNHDDDLSDDSAKKKNGKLYSELIEGGKK